MTAYFMMKEPLLKSMSILSDFEQSRLGKADTTAMGASGQSSELSIDSQAKLSTDILSSSLMCELLDRLEIAASRCKTTME